MSVDVKHHVYLLRKDVVNQCLEFGSNLTSKPARKHEMHPPRVKKKSSVSSQTIVVFKLV